VSITSGTVISRSEKCAADGAEDGDARGEARGDAECVPRIFGKLQAGVVQSVRGLSYKIARLRQADAAREMISQT